MSCNCIPWLPLLPLILPFYPPPPALMVIKKQSLWSSECWGGGGMDYELKITMVNPSKYGFFIYPYCYSNSLSLTPHFSPSAIPNYRKSALSERRRKRWGPKATRGRGRPPFCSKGGRLRLLLLLLPWLLAFLLSGCCCCCCHGCQKGLTASPHGYIARSWSSQKWNVAASACIMLETAIQNKNCSSRGRTIDRPIKLEQLLS